MPASPIRKLAPLADAAKQRGVHVFHLNIGQPDLPTPQVALDAIHNINRSVLEYSPSAGFRSYREKLVGYYAKYNIHLTADDIIVTAGGSEAVLFAFLACLNPGDEIIVPEPAYANYMAFAISAGARIRSVTTTIDEGFALPKVEKFEELINERTRAILICNPNNPTGNTVSRDAIIRVLEAAKDAIVAVDEAYIEFCPQATIVDLIEKYSNLAVIRTLSKAFALAGLRCGMILAQENLIAALRKVIAPYPVPEPVAAIAAHALSEGGIAAMRQRVELIRGNRTYLKESLVKIPGVRSVYPSQTNFVLFKVDEPERIYKSLWEKGVAIREPGSDKGVLRVSVGTIGECKLFINKLTQVLQEAGS